MRSGRHGAQALVWFTLCLPLFVSIMGLAIDGGVLLAARRELQSVADGAARAGATRLDVQRLRSSGGTDVQLDPALAQRAARTYLLQSLVDDQRWTIAPQADVNVQTRRVHVLLRSTLQTAFLRIVNIQSVPVEAEAWADVEYGIHDGQGR